MIEVRVKVLWVWKEHNKKIVLIRKNVMLDRSLDQGGDHHKRDCPKKKEKSRKLITQQIYWHW